MALEFYLLCHFIVIFISYLKEPSNILMTRKNILSQLPDKDVTIIGAGIIGICCALSLLKRGISVRIIEKAGIADATSYGNAGVVSPWSCIPQSMPGIWKAIPGMLLDSNSPLSIHPKHFLNFLPWGMRFINVGNTEKKAEKISIAMHALNDQSIDLYQDYLSGTGQESLLTDSWAIHAHRKANAVEMSDLGIQLRLNVGANIEIVDGPTLQDIEPALSKQYKTAVLIKGQARTVNPGKLAKSLAEKAIALGADFQSLSVNSLTPQENKSWDINTEQGTFNAKKVIVAAGADSMQLLKPLGINIPLEQERGYHIEFHDPQVSLSHSVMDAEYKFISSSMEAGIRSAGTAEFAGANTPPNYQRAEMLKALTKQMIPDIQIGETKKWMGVRPSFPDSLPCLCELPDLKGLFTAFGHSHYGLSMGPKTGEILADLVTNTDSDTDITPYRIERF